jgi:hypothetical protein
MFLRYVGFLKENYFGSNVNFVTLDEFRDRLDSDAEATTETGPSRVSYISKFLDS